MSLVIDQWKNSKYHFGNGIYFPNDTVVPIFTNERGEYYCGPREDINMSMIKYNQDTWADFYYTGNLKYKNYQLKFSGGDCEGEGIVILEKNNVLEWIFHLNNSEEITNVTFEGNNIRVFAEYYLHKNTFIIPINEPEKFIFQKNYEL